MARSHFRNCLIVAMSALVVASASAQVTPSRKGYVFRAKFVKGATAKYSVKTSGAMQGMKFVMTLPMSEKVLSVTKGGGMIAFSTGKSSLLLNGKPMSMPVPIDNQKRNVALDIHGNAINGESLQTHIPLPKNPILVGGTWTATSSAAFGPGQQLDVTTVYKFVGFASIAGKKAVKLSMTQTGAGGATASGSGTLWLDAADCSTLKQSGKITVSQGSLVVPTTVEVTRK
jgi:hypothetical protein